MISRTLQIAALSLAALGLAPGASHLMQLPVKMGYPAEMYAAVTSSLYAWYGLVGGLLQMGALVAVTLLAIRARRLPAGALAAASAGALLASLLLWGFVVGPVNAAWSDAVNLGPTSFVAAYDEMRGRWEYGHLAAFIAWLTGWFALVAFFTRRSQPPELVARVD
jgi:hypothetical protein